MHPRAKQLRQIARSNQNKHFWWAVLITLLATLLAGDFASGVNLSFNLGDSSFDLYNGAYAVDDAMSGLRDFFLNPLVSALATLSTLLGLAATAVLRFRQGQGKGGLPACILITAACILLALCNLAAGLYRLAANFGG